MATHVFWKDITAIFAPKLWLMMSTHERISCFPFQWLRGCIECRTKKKRRKQSSFWGNTLNVISFSFKSKQIAKVHFIGNISRAGPSQPDPTNVRTYVSFAKLKRQTDNSTQRRRRQRLQRFGISSGFRMDGMMMLMVEECQARFIYGGTPWSWLVMLSPKIGFGGFWVCFGQQSASCGFWEKLFGNLPGPKQ